MKNTFPKASQEIPCVNCGGDAQTKPGYRGNTPRCPACRAKRKLKSFAAQVSSWDRWANGNQYGAYNSDED